MPVVGRKIHQDKYGPPQPIGNLRLMSKTVTDPLYRQHGKETPIYMYLFVQDEIGNNFGISNGGKLRSRDEMDDWEASIMEGIDRDAKRT